MTIGQDFTLGDTTELTTTALTHQSTGITITSLSSRGAAFYFQCAVVAIGIVGTAANGLVLYALVASNQHKKHILIFNQNLLDFVTCLFLSVMYGAKFWNTYLEGTRGYWLCLTLLGEGPGWGPFIGSLINLEAITVERYLKVVHDAWAKKNLRKWMIYAVMVFAWIGGIVIAAAVTIHTAAVVNGVCYSLAFWKDHTAQMAFGVWYFVSCYVIVLLIFIFCYGRILVTVRRQTSVMAAHSAAGSSAAPQTQSKQIQTNVIKTMMLVSVLFAITCAPLQVYFLILNVDSSLVSLRENGFYAILFISYLYNCANPFIYATKFDPVKRILLGLIPCKKTTQPAGNIEVA